jgi:branched-chain amino acid aminotransferase
MPKLVWLNGQISPLEEATTTVRDHAHLYGDGLFEGIRIYNRKIFKLDEHLNRLYNGIRYMNIKMMISQEELRQIILETCRKADLDDGYIRINVTRGTGLGLDPSKIDQTPNVMVMVSTLRIYDETYYQKGIHVITSPFRVIPPDSLDPRVKCIGRYAVNILAKAHAHHAGAGEALMLNQQGYVAECTGDNIFLIHKDILLTPHSSSGILKGITRDTVITLAQNAGYTIQEEFLTPYDIYAADEAFLTGTAAEVIPFVNLDGRPIGNGKPGPITEHLTKLFHEHTKTGTPFDAKVNICPLVTRAPEKWVDRNGGSMNFMMPRGCLP